MCLTSPFIAFCFYLIAFCTLIVPTSAQQTQLPQANPVPTAAVSTPPSSSSSPTPVSSSPTPVSSSVTSSAPTATADPCANGRCQPAGKSKECLVISKVWMYREFNAQAYLPVDLSEYFKERFDNFDAASFPKEFDSNEMYGELFGNSVWSYWGRYYDRYSLRQAGCALPTQKFYLVWTLIDIYEYYQSKNDECARGPALEVCAATLDQRSDRVVADLNNKTLCNAPPEFINVGRAYADRVRNHPFRSSSPTCADGLQVEADAGKCGWYTQYSACINQDTCPTLSQDLKAQCPAIISQFNAIYNPNLTPVSSSASNNQSMINIIVPSVIGAVIAIAMAAGLVALKFTRKKSSDVLKPDKALDDHPEAAAPATGRDSVMSSATVSRFSMGPKSFMNDVGRLSMAPFTPSFMGSGIDSHRTSTIMYVDPDGNPVGGPIVIGQPGAEGNALEAAQPPFLMHHPSPLSADGSGDPQFVMYVDENGVPVSTPMVPESAEPASKAVTGTK